MEAPDDIQQKTHDDTYNATSYDGYKTKTEYCHHVHCPDHADYVRNLTTGEHQMHEHLLLPKLTGVSRLMCFTNKADVIDAKGSPEYVQLPDGEFERSEQATVGFWNPTGFTRNGNAAAYNRRRATEIGRGRVAMLAIVAGTLN